MPPSPYSAPDNLGEALGLAAAPGARVLAGGTDLLIQTRAGRLAPTAMVDLKRIDRAMGIRPAGQGFVIGAATPCTALRDDAALVAAWPGVVEAASLIGSVQVRNRASLGGNLCNASPAADSVPALIAAGATAVVAGPGGEREVPVEAIPAGPGRTTLAPGELVIELRLPPRPPGGGDAYLRLTPRTEMDIAVVGVGAALVLDGSGRCTAARIALGAVAPTALLVEAAGAALVGTKLEEGAIAAMLAAIDAAISPIDDQRASAAYRRRIAGVLATRAVARAAARARGEQA
ncbi:MAG: xanthine dehydrogenase family protein subunit M [Proteobacteria bacterium]|nr:xanthine dehydrogenase family protein subunit M [Pseudomonadota bacterium]